MFNITAIIFISVVVASAAAAHPGHGESDAGFGLAHYLTEPTHVFGALVLVAALFTAAHAWRRSRVSHQPVRRTR